MKRIISIIVVAVLAVSMLAMTSCGKKEFSGSIDDEKNMTITANRADEGDYFMTGTLEVADGEEVTIDSNLESGSISVQFIGSGGEQNIEELPELIHSVRGRNRLTVCRLRHWLIYGKADSN